MALIKLKSSDDEIFVIDMTIAEQMITVKNMLNDLEVDDDEIIIPLVKINSKVLQKIVSFCDHHRYEPPLPELPKPETLSQSALLPDPQLDTTTWPLGHEMLSPNLPFIK